MESGYTKRQLREIRLQRKLQSCMRDIEAIQKIYEKKELGFISYANKENYLLATVFSWLLSDSKVNDVVRAKVIALCREIVNLR